MENGLLEGLIGAIIGAALGIIGTFLTLRFYYKQLYAQTVSSNRMDWINVWRDNISTFLALAEELNFQRTSFTSEQGVQLKKAKNEIITRLNMKEEKHVLMCRAINELDYTMNREKFVAQKEYIILLTQEILKPEWERVKAEAKGKNYGKSK